MQFGNSGSFTLKHFRAAVSLKCIKSFEFFEPRFGQPCCSLRSGAQVAAARKKGSSVVCLCMKR